MESQETDTEASGPAHTHAGDVAGTQPRYNLRSTGDVNKGEHSSGIT